MSDAPLPALGARVAVAGVVLAYDAAGLAIIDLGGALVRVPPADLSALDAAGPDEAEGRRVLHITELSGRAWIFDADTQETVQANLGSIRAAEAWAKEHFPAAEVRLSPAQARASGKSPKDFS